MPKNMGQQTRFCGTIGKTFERTSFCRIIVETNIRRSLVEEGLENVPGWECLYMYRNSGLRPSLYVDDAKMLCKRQA